MVPNRIRLSAVGRSRRLIVEARGFRGSAPVSVFYFTRPKSILTAGAWFVPEIRSGGSSRGSVQFAQAPRVGGMFQVLGGLHQLVGVAGQLAGMGLVGVFGAVGEGGLPERHDAAERGGAFQSDVEVAVERAGKDGIRHGAHFVGARRLSRAGHHVGYLGGVPSRPEIDADALRILD